MKNSSIIKKALPAAVVLACAGGLSSNANASAYAISYDNVFNLSVLSAPFVPLSDFNSFTATSSVGANLNGLNDPGQPANSDITGGPVDAVVTYGLGSVFPGAAPGNNAMTAVGQGGNYAYGDAQVSSTALTQADFFSPVVATGNLTQAWNIAEGYIANDGFADASGLNGSVTGFNTTITLQEATSFSFTFNADPYMYVEISPDAAGTSNANLDVTFTITSGGTTVFDWAPDGVLGSGITGGVETADPFNLNGSIEVGNPGESAVFDPCGNGAPTGVVDRGCAGSNLFSASTFLLQPGIYTISLDMVENIDILTQARPPVPAPGILALFGLALAGLGVSRRRAA